MPSFNQAEFIGRSIDSVFAGSDLDIELIIADGGSTDGTLDILRDKAAQYDQLIWSSQPDTGPADALNKAFSQVRGQIVGWLNSDDVYADGAIDRARQALSEHPNWIMCYGHGEHIDADDQFIGPYPTLEPRVGLQGFEVGCFICQPTVFFKTPMLTLLGQLDESQKTSFDYDFWLRAFAAFPERIGFVDALQAKSRLHDACITQNLRRTVAVEGVRLARNYLGRGVEHWLVTYLEDVRTDFQKTAASGEFEAHASALIDEVADCFDDHQLARLRGMIQ